MYNSSGTKQNRTNSSHSKRNLPTTTPAQENQHWQQYQGYDYSSYYAAWQNYQSQNPYYAYDQNYAGYGPGYQYPASAQYPPYPQPYSTAPADEAQVSSQAPAEQQQPPAAQYHNYSAAYETDENTIEEHDVPINVDQLNKEVMARSNDLYGALDESRWLPTDGLDPPYVKRK